MEILSNNTAYTLAIIKDVLTIVSLIIASIIAILGFFLWKKQLRGTQSYELAKKILKTVYHVRNLLLLARYPITDSEEFIASKVIEEEYKDEINEIFWDGCICREVHDVRWKKIREELDNLEIDACEAEALWGDDKRATIMFIKSIAIEFRYAVEEYLGLIFSGINQTTIYDSFKNVLDIAFCNPAHPNDDFDKKVNNIVNTITKTLRPYLIK